MVILAGHALLKDGLRDLVLMAECHSVLLLEGQDLPATADISGEEVTLLGKDSAPEVLWY